MDAHHRRERRGNQHLQWQGQPADKQTHGDSTRDRASIQVPDHRLREGIFEPDFCPRSRAGRAVTQAKAVSHSPLHIVGSWQSVFQPFSAHVTDGFGLFGVTTCNVGLPKILNAVAELRELGGAVRLGVPAWHNG